MKANDIRCYKELSKLKTFKERYEYLRLDGIVGFETFGSSRWVNQEFYRSKEWKDIRRKVIIRDCGCDLGIEDYEIHNRDKIIIHHMNPITLYDIENFTPLLVDPEYLISCSYNTHNAIHYGDSSNVFTGLVERKPNDMCPWKL